MDKQEPTYFTISSGTIIKAILLVALAVLLYFLRDILLIILVAVVIASAIEPATRWLVRHKIPRVIAVVLLYLIGSGLFVGAFYLFLPSLLNEIAIVMENAPQYLEALQIGDIFSTTSVDEVNQSLTTGELLRQVQNLLTGASSGAFGFLSNIFGGVLSFILIIVLSFYMAVQKNGITNFLRLVTPYQHESYIIDLWARVQRKIGRWLQGQIVLMTLVGIMTYIGLSLLGVRNALLLGVLAGLFEIIPVLGPVLASVPAIVFALIDGGAGLALWVAILFVIVQQVENHVLHPVVVNRVVGVPPLVVIIALLIGGKLAGFLGVLIAVPIAAAILEFTDDIERRKARVQESLQLENTTAQQS